ncbi:hypothetical protein CVT24_010413 [Panaeolus cyanescens]|uniref:ATP12-domain-containing protein n=1 Tax=Panaeolus cyanescens TaxID=181874 RepID=A0A409YPN2_9AGAR|nr:hypothetical protein CVT24_010413 [Panaeolus cyanescens]
MLTQRLSSNISTLLVCRSAAARRLTPSATRIRWKSTSAESPDDLTNNSTKLAEATLKRFWKTVDIERRGDSFAVTLDKRALKTPGGQTLLLPLNKALPASLIAAEWDLQETLIKPHALPMTSIVSRAVDTMRDEATRTEVREALLKYFDTDTVCFFHDSPEPLERLQSEHWTPLIEWTRKTFDVKINVSNSILSADQPPETREKFGKLLETFDEWEMAAMERAVLATKSFITALAVVKKHLTVEEAARVASVEVDSQIERWGEVEDTHDVDYQDVRRQLGSAACLLSTV